MTMTQKIFRYSGLLLLCICFGLLPASSIAAQPTQATNTVKEKAENTTTTDFDELDSLLEFSTLPASKTGEKTTDDKVRELAEKSKALRDPLWPIGFKPKPKTPEKKETAKKKKPPKPVNIPHWDEAVRKLSIKGIMSAGGGQYMAMINGQVVGEGDKVSIVYKKLKYSWRIKTISEDGVAFQKLDKKK